MADRGAEPGAAHGAGHEYLRGRDEPAGGDRSRLRRSGTPDARARGRRRRDRAHPVHPLASRSLPWRRVAARAHGRAGARPADARRRAPGPGLRARCGVRRRRVRRGRRRPAARGPHAGPRLEPRLLPARGHRPAVHRRSPDERLDGDHHPARRFDAPVPRLAAPPARAATGRPRARPRRADAGCADRDRSRPRTHRLAREGKLAGAFARRRTATLDDVLAEVYDDVPKFMHVYARYSLLAHAAKLVEEGRARLEDGVYRWQGD